MSNPDFAYHLARKTWPFELVMSERLDLGAGPSAPAKARDAIAALKERVGPAVLADATLLVSELVSNAVRHGHADDENHHVIMYIALSPERLRVEVCDGGPGFDPRNPPPPRPDSGRMGLLFVDKLSSRWGVSTDDGACVWFELDRSAAGAT
jgi:anti-sigma regulatory factor (Ser/Thr protein kinase)